MDVLKVAFVSSALMHSKFHKSTANVNFTQQMLHVINVNSESILLVLRSLLLPPNNFEHVPLLLS